jgi:hypothetical protein
MNTTSALVILHAIPESALEKMFMSAHVDEYDELNGRYSRHCSDA